MKTNVGHDRLYATLCKVLDALRHEAPLTSTAYHPAAGNQDALIQARSRALLHLFLKARFGLVDFLTREKYVTDGPHDGGIDAFYIDEKSKQIYVIQSKFRANPKNFVSVNMSVDDLLKMDVGRILKGNKQSENGDAYNDGICKLLQPSIRKLSDIASYTVNVVLLGNAKQFTEAQLKKLVEGYPVEQFPHDRCYKELLFPVVNGTYFADPNLSIEINLSNLKGDTNLDYDVKAETVRANIKLLFVPTAEIGRIMSTYKNSLLKYNPRSFLELDKNPVNQAIRESITASKANEFALFNNGVTMLSDRTGVSSDTAQQGKAQIVLRNPQLVNGGQTAYTLGRVYEECKSSHDFTVFRGKEVLLRVITFVDQGKKPTPVAQKLALIGEISKASNSQTKIEESDRRSNDPIQLDLQEAFFSKFGLYYERKRGEFADGIREKYISGDLIVDRDRLIRVCLACEYRINQARASISKYFDATSLAALFDVKLVSKYAMAYEAFGILESKRKEKPQEKGDRYHVAQYGQALRYGLYAVVASAVNTHKTADESAEERISRVLSHWRDFEIWVVKKTSNAVYGSSGSFDFVNYYKGSTINSDVREYAFA